MPPRLSLAMQSRLSQLEARYLRDEKRRQHQDGLRMFELLERVEMVVFHNATDQDPRVQELAEALREARRPMLEENRKAQQESAAYLKALQAASVKKDEPKAESYKDKKEEPNAP